MIVYFIVQQTINSVERMTRTLMLGIFIVDWGGL